MASTNEETTRTAAEAGDPMAMLEVGLQLLKEKEEAPAAEGVAWLVKCIAARENMLRGTRIDGVLGSACYALGYAYDAGRGVQQDTKASTMWIRRSARHGNRQARSVLSARRKDFWRRRFWDVLLLLCIVVFLGVCKTLVELIYVVAHREEYKDEVSGADPDTPDFAWHRNAIPAARRTDMIQRALDLVRRTTAANPLSDSFAHSRGVVAHFTRAALNDSRALGSPELSWLRDGYISELLDERCNAFVFNVLVVPPGRSKNRTKGVDFHVDQTLIQCATHRDQSAFTVSVGYLQVPPNIDGGELLLAGMRHPPHEGSVLVFRGDQNHAVSAFCAGGNWTRTSRAPYECDIDTAPHLQRISFVLEQYRLDKTKLKRSPSFILAPSDFEQELISVLTAFPLGPSFVEVWLALRKRAFWRRRPEVPCESDEGDDVCSAPMA